jgi:hypothetical protein
VPDEEDVRQFAKFNFGPLASPYITPYIHRGAVYLDREYGLLRDMDGKFRVGNSEVEIHYGNNIVIGNRKFKE